VRKNGGKGLEKVRVSMIFGWPILLVRSTLLDLSFVDMKMNDWSFHWSLYIFVDPCLNGYL